MDAVMSGKWKSLEVLELCVLDINDIRGIDMQRCSAAWAEEDSIVERIQISKVMMALHLVTQT